MNKFSLLITALICFMTVSLSAQSIVGKWKFEFPTDQGTMVMAADIKADGTYALDFGNDGSVETTGKYTQDGNTMTIQDDGGDCTGKGVYQVSVDGDTMTMVRVSDECANRGGPEGKMVTTRL
ncbi:lipocalin-like domain-containing protein [Flavilitoribacter nigricans]|uniref:Lipocalin-like domain-containing protein n=1 Tax=Flavilitoribacter nigricans (strain ATCC 23147 / DSM 23189 / NBRC 102662 / NCIMB 1420 / SS-2) TaxID=1122177 RepID=A0A2D0N8A1_FLAN2|nr:lipocalin family protein [Flavilitoribacter nigricans]PHN04626.1 hypothetical protein CRP01_21735 [Flavilitoribacter nigricans DSM 23189 = NBRC 102662]